MKWSALALAKLLHNEGRCSQTAFQLSDALPTPFHPEQHSENHMKR
jgi:hypothetical protein